MLIYWLALIAGAILPLAFSPFGIYAVAFISPALLCYLWIKSTPKQALLCGLLFGIGFFGVGFSWISISIHNFGNVSLWLTWIATLGLACFLSLFIAIPGYLFQRYGGTKPLALQCLCLFPAVWLLSEYLRSTLLTGLPWLLLGYSQTDSFLRGLSPLIGTYGISLVVTLIAGSFVLCLTSKTLKNRLIAIGILLILIIPASLLHDITWSKSTGKSIKVSLIQGNFEQFLKWDSHLLQTILQTYLQLSMQHRDSRIIVWPEAAIPFYPSQLPSYMDQIKTLASDSNTLFLLGAPTTSKNKKRFFNSLLMVGASSAQYDKHFLVPFGEYTPFESWLEPLFNSFSVPMSDFSKGAKQQGILHDQELKIAPFICYEIIYPNYVIKHSMDSQLLVVINDDGWFGRSIALAQHLQMAQMAALQTNRFVLFCSNTGITAIIDPLGKIIKSGPIDQRLVVTGPITPQQGNTPLMVIGFLPTAVITVLLLLLGLIL